MKYLSMPFGMWTIFSKSFKKQLMIVFGYDKKEAKLTTKKAKIKYKEIIKEIPEFEKEDIFKMNIVNCALLISFVLSMKDIPTVEQLTKYYKDAMMTNMMKWFCKQSAKTKYTEKDIKRMTLTSKLKAADRNEYSWNMDYYPYSDGSGYEARFTRCGICMLMKKYGLYDLTPSLCNLDYIMAEAGGVTNFVREYTLASGGPYCDCGYKKK